MDPELLQKIDVGDEAGHKSGGTGMLNVDEASGCIEIPGSED